MRKIFLLLTTVFALSFIACEAENENVTSSQNTENEELLTTTSGGFKIIYLDIGKKKNNCNGIWGVCKFCVICDGPEKPDLEKAADHIMEQIDTQQTYIGTSSVSHDSYMELPIYDNYEDQIGKNMFIDEDITSEDGNFKIVQGEYIYQSDIGKNGGYRIHLVKN